MLLDSATSVKAAVQRPKSALAKNQQSQRSRILNERNMNCLNNVSIISDDYELFMNVCKAHSLPCIDGNYFNQWVLSDLGQIQPCSSQSFPFLLLLTQKTHRVTLNTNTASHTSNGTNSSCRKP